MRKAKPSVLRGLATGIASGIAATLIMDQFQKLATAGQKEAEKRRKLANHESLWQIAQNKPTKSRNKRNRKIPPRS